MKINFRSFALAVLIAAIPGLGFAQLSTQSTTLTTAAVNASATQTPASYNTLYVASTTGMLSPLFAGEAGSAQTYLYIDHEFMPVIGIPSTTSVQVQRGSPSGGQFGSSPTAHVNSSVVWFGPYNNFMNADPSGTCVAANYPYLPLISVSTGHLINCDAVSSTNSVFARTGSSWIVNPSVCLSQATTTTTTDNGSVYIAAGNLAHTFTTNGTAGSTAFTCPINPPSSLLNSAKGIIVTGTSLLYGVQGSGGITGTMATPTFKTVTYPIATAAAETAAGTVAAAGGTITAIPTVLPQAATTSGSFYNLLASLGNPYYYNTAAVNLSFNFVLANSTTALTYQIGGLQVFYDEPL